MALKMHSVDRSPLSVKPGPVLLGANSGLEVLRSLLSRRLRSTSGKMSGFGLSEQARAHARPVPHFMEPNNTRAIDPPLSKDQVRLN